MGIAAWGAIFLGRGAGEVEELTAGTAISEGDRPRELLEATSSGNLGDALAAVPPGSREQVADATREGFLAGMNDILTFGAGLAFVGAIVSLWLVRERDIAREATLAQEPAYGAERVPEPAAA